MAYKCPKTLRNTGLSGILCFNQNYFATRNSKSAKGIVVKGLQVKKEKRGITYEVSMLWSRDAR